MKTIIANWKMNPSILEEAMELFDFYLAEISKYQNIQLVVCPPFVYLEELAKKLLATHYPLLTLGSQDLFWEKSGSYTGEVSVDMLHPVKSSEAGAKQFDRVKNFGVTHVLVGHSDRRYKIGETDEVINKKIKAVIEADIMPVLLVGECNRYDDRKQVLETQLGADLAGLTAEQISKILIAYEPVWAISTTPGSEPDTPENTLEAIKIIKGYSVASSNQQAASSHFFYGGSINEKNVADFLQHPEISGAVIGGASLRKEEFGNILKIVSSL